MLRTLLPLLFTQAVFLSTPKEDKLFTVHAWQVDALELESAAALASITGTTNISPGEDGYVADWQGIRNKSSSGRLPLPGANYAALIYRRSGSEQWVLPSIGQVLSAGSYEYRINDTDFNNKGTLELTFRIAEKKPGPKPETESSRAKLERRLEDVGDRLSEITADLKDLSRRRDRYEQRRDALNDRLLTETLTTEQVKVIKDEISKLDARIEDNEDSTAELRDERKKLRDEDRKIRAKLGDD